MNWALWKKAVADAWVQLVTSALVLCLFCWLFVWLMSFLKIGAWGNLLGLVPDFFRPIMGAPLDQLASPTGQLSFLYIHVITLLVCVGWAIGRGSDIVAGEIARGTMEHLLTLPVWRVTVIVAPAVVTMIGSAVLALSVWAGIVLGLATVEFHGPVAVLPFLSGSVNLFAMTFCLAGVAAFLSAFEHDRWRAIWRAGGFFVISMIVKLVARMWPDGQWLYWFTFLSLFEPQNLIFAPDDWAMFIRYNLALAAMGLAAHAAAALVFWYRDIPVPH
ncbi:MAG: ABC transporter permease subunit [Pirellulales bacterium]|nr:ABC transporter permease subunit [Pirellulales bacterium]